VSEALLLPHPHHPLDQFFSHFAFIVISFAGMIAGISGSQPANLYPFLIGLAGGIIGLP
jgi:hypothetical protein